MSTVPKLTCRMQFSDTYCFTGVTVQVPPLLHPVVSDATWGDKYVLLAHVSLAPDVSPDVPSTSWSALLRLIAIRHITISTTSLVVVLNASWWTKYLISIVHFAPDTVWHAKYPSLVPIAPECHLMSSVIPLLVPVVPDATWHAKYPSRHPCCPWCHLTY
jgi:hypothetical protein